MERVAFFVYSPGQLHFYKHIMKMLHDDGIDVRLLVRDYGENITLAKGLGLDYKVFSNSIPSKFGKILSLPTDVMTTFSELHDFKPDLIIGGGLVDIYASRLLRARDVGFNDGEPRTSKPYALQLHLSIPLMDAIITPDCFLDDLGPKQIKINSYKELAYLHPSRFNPDPGILDDLNLNEGERFVVLRFNAFDAVHDYGCAGFSMEQKMQLIEGMKRDAKVFISLEGEVPPQMKAYLLPTPKHRIHDVLYFADMCVTDTGTMTTEAAVLGTPSVMTHPKVDMYGNFVELRDRYNLIWAYPSPSDAVSKALEIIKDVTLKHTWQPKREKLLEEKVDMTDFMVRFIKECLSGKEVTGRVG